MPKRTTLTFTSEDAPAANEEKLYVYYCKFTGKHAFTVGKRPGWFSEVLGAPGLLEGCTDLARYLLGADADINKLPRRRTDGARIVDTDVHTIKLYTSDGGVKLIKRCAHGVFAWAGVAALLAATVMFCTRAAAWGMKQGPSQTRGDPWGVAGAEARLMQSSCLHLQAQWQHRAPAQAQRGHPTRGLPVSTQGLGKAFCSAVAGHCAAGQ